jgi:CDGSH-type Zn-finger protein
MAGFTCPGCGYLAGMNESARAVPEAPEAPEAAASVTVYPDGPLIVRGNFEIRDVDGTPVETGHAVALCRCGRSALKPLCDGSHKNAGQKLARTHT